MRHLYFILSCVLLGSAALCGAEPKFVELVEGGKAYEGKVVGRNDEKIWLVQRDGRMHTLEVKKIESFRKLADKFFPLSSAQVRDQLRRELVGERMDIVGAGRYLVAGPSALAGEYAQLFDDQYRAVFNYFSVRGFRIHEPEFPLIAIIFPDAKSFAKYAAKDKVEAKGGLKGYYVQSSNRIALYVDAPSADTAAVAPRFQIPFWKDSRALAADRLQLSPWFQASEQSPLNHWASIDSKLEATMIHEATHQVAFNIGIHTRVGQINPRWIVEGLATVFEAPGIRSSSLAKTPGAKLNLMRLHNFQDFVHNRRQPKSLAAFVQNDEAFKEHVIDGYAQAWALTYFLIETRPREYAQLLQSIAARPATEVYDGKQRLADFENAFGHDWLLLEAKFLRYIEEVAPPPSHVVQRPKKIRTLDDLRRNGINPINKSQLVPLSQMPLPKPIQPVEN